MLLLIRDYIRSSVSDEIFPRKKALENLTLIIKRYPQLGQDAASVLLAITEAIHTNATAEEINVSLQNTLASEVYVRNSSLQSLQVSRPIRTRIFTVPISVLAFRSNRSGLVARVMDSMSRY